MSITLSTDAMTSSVCIDLPKATAEDIENLIHELATARQEMLPEVPRHRPQHLLLINEPDIRMKISDDGLIAFAVRSAGLGWLDIPFTRRDSSLTVVACARAAGEMKHNAEILGPAGGNA